jgi:hypothetical protein
VCVCSIQSFVAIFLGYLQELCSFGSHNLITWCPASFKRVCTHSRSMTIGLPISFSQSLWRFLGVRVCVLNFYDFIIPYFKPFVHCWPSSFSSTWSIEILWDVFLCVWVCLGRWENGAKIRTNRFCMQKRLDTQTHLSCSIDLDRHHWPIWYNFWWHSLHLAAVARLSILWRSL